MRKLLGAVILAVLIGTGTDALALGQVTFGIQIGRPPSPRVVEVRPIRPGRDYVWVDGFWYPRANGRGYLWRSGYWVLPPFGGAYWVAPRYDNNRYYSGYWSGHRDRDHDHGRHGNNNRHNHNDHH